MKFDMTGYQDAEGKLTNLNQEDDLGFWESVGDVAFSPIRGIAGAAEGVYDLADWAVGDCREPSRARAHPVGGLHLGRSSSFIKEHCGTPQTSSPGECSS